MFKTLTIFITLTLGVVNVSAQFKDRIKLLLSSEIPVEISIQSVTLKYVPGNAEPVYSIRYSITNRSDSVLSQIAFIEYKVNNERKVVGTTFWSERDAIRPNETKEFSTSSSFADYLSSIGVWSVTSICTEFGSMQLDLTGVEQSVLAYIADQSHPLPKARGSLFPKCNPDP